MEFLILIAIPTLIVWGLVFFKAQLNTRANLLPTLGLLVVILGSVLGSEFFQIPAPIPITLDRLVLVGLVGLFGLLWFRGVETLRFNRTDVILAALLVVLTFSTLTHDFRFLKNMPASRLLFFYIVPLVLYAVMRSTRINSSDLKWIAGLLGAFAVYLAITAIFETRGMTSLVFPRYIMESSQHEFLGRGRGPFLNPVSNGIFMVTGVCGLWLWWDAGATRIKIVLLAITGLVAVGIFCTLTRSIWLSFMASAGFLVWFRASRQSQGAIIILATLVTIVAFPLISEKINSFKRDKEVSQSEMEQSASLRPLFAIVAWKMFQDRPVLGCGFGQYARAKYPYLQDPYSGRPLAATKHFMQHNVFLSYLTETGIIGLLLLLLVLLQMLIASWSVWKNPDLESNSRFFGALMIVVLINFLINGMFHDVSIIPMQNMLMFFIFGIVNNVYTEQSEFMISRAPKLSPDSLPAIVRPRNLGQA